MHVIILQYYYSERSLVAHEIKTHKNATHYKTLDINPQLLSVQIVLTPGLYPGLGIYAGPDFYQIILKSLIFAANTLAYGIYCIRLMVLGITASEKHSIFVTYK